MKQSDNSLHRKDIEKIWKTSDNLMNTKYKLTQEDMEKILVKESTGFIKKFRANICFDIVFKCIICSGLLIIWLVYPSNLLVAGTTLFMLILSLLLVIRLTGIMKTGRSVHDFTKSTTDALKTSISFYAGHSTVVPLSWGLSSAGFFILGSFLYYHFKYGIINPFQDVQDILVLCLFMAVGIILSYTSHRFATHSQFRNLGRMVDDMKDETEFQLSRKSYIRSKTNRYLMGIILSVFGLILLIAIIILLRS